MYRYVIIEVDGQSSRQAEPNGAEPERPRHGVAECFVDHMRDRKYELIAARPGPRHVDCVIGRGENDSHTGSKSASRDIRVAGEKHK